MKILLAQKDDSLNEILHMLLKSFKYDVVISRGTEDTLATVKSESPDLILIDRNLEDSDGLEITKAIKGDFLTAYIPIIVLFDRRQLRKDLLTIEQGIDDYIIKPPDPIDLQIRIEMAVRRATHQFFANALTKLPGNRTIELSLKRAIQSGQRFSFGYVDINRFKYFNDHYGYLKGDIAIIQTSQIISRAVKTFGNETDFVGHVGGDDFVFITTPQKERGVACEIIREFDRLIPFHYSKKDRLKGSMQIRDRQGKLCRTRLMNISIALVDNVDTRIGSIIELSKIAFEIKSHLKSTSGSNFLKNRRMEDSGVQTRSKKPTNRLKQRIETAKSTNKNKPLGQLLLEADIINEEVLDEALVKHWRTGQKLGQALIRMGKVNENRILDILKSQGATT